MLQKYLSRVFKGALVCGLFAAIFKGQSNNNPTVHKVYVYIIKVCHHPQLKAACNVASLHVLSMKLDVWHPLNHHIFI